MYAVVGCDECSYLWIVEGRPERSQCPRCGRTRQYAKRRKFVSTDDEDHARDVRASMLAERQDESEAFAAVDSFADLDERVDRDVVDDEEYLEGSGIDPDEVAAAGERATGGPGESRSDPEVVRAAIREQGTPTREAVLAYATDRGVSREKADRLLDRLADRGEVVEGADGYRLL